MSISPENEVNICLRIMSVLSYSFNRVFCQMLSARITRGFEKREVELRAKSGPKSLKLAEKRQAKAEKRLKKTRDETEKEKGKRYLIYIYNI